MKARAFRGRRPLLLAFTASLLLLLALLAAPGWLPFGPQEPRPDPGVQVAPAPTGEPLRIVFFDVGQGDAVFVRSPEGRLALIDGGRSRTLVADLLEDLMGDLGAERLDLVIASHADLDHIGGLPEAVRRFRPRFYMDNGVPHSTQAYSRLLEAVEEVEATYLEAESRTLTLGSLELRILPPPRQNQDQNDNSVGVVLAYEGFHTVLSGDATTRTQGWWLERFSEELANVQVYKAAHHGSSTGDGPEFMRALSPEVVVISVGENNPYGHPTPEALASYEGAGARIYRTDRQGHITVTAWPGGALEVSAGTLPNWSEPGLAALGPEGEGSVP